MVDTIRQTQDDQARREEELKGQPLVTKEREQAERPYNHPDYVAEPKQFNPTLFNEILEELTGGKTDSEMEGKVSGGKWPFALSADQLREDIKNWGR